MDLHKLLRRQLKHIDLNSDSMPDDLNKWLSFLGSINRTYKEFDQDRYLIDRSIKISSQEMENLNEKLERAQKIARLGYWTYDRSSLKSTWSKEIYHMFDLDFTQPILTIEMIITLLHPYDKQQFTHLIDMTFAEKKECEAEVRIKHNSDTYCWYQIITRPIIKTGEPITQLNGVIININKRKEGEEKIEALNKQLLSSARRAGMADVATSILHNVGNILNSANVAIEVILEDLNSISLENFIEAVKMLDEHVDHLADFLTKDEKGKLLLKYFYFVANELIKNQNKISGEINELKEHIKHIKDITTLQKNLSGISGLVEKIFVPEVIDAAIKMCDPELQNHRITIKKIFNDNFFINTDKTKLLQILVNLIQNAKDALMEVWQQAKCIHIELSKHTHDLISITVKDNGVGIPQENLIHIFSFGFTTKENGHGFGLHSSALVAKELGGKLEAFSAGKNQGATFILSLPTQIPLKGGKP